MLEFYALRDLDGYRQACTELLEACRVAIGAGRYSDDCVISSGTCRPTPMRRAGSP